jgi:hypothetical protein
VAVVGEASIVIRAITKDFEKDVKKALKSVNTGGGSGGSAFSKLDKEAEAARKKIDKLIVTGYRLAPVLAGTAGAVGDLAMGLFSVGSAVGAAAPALVVLPGILSAVAQAGIAAKLAFAGVGKAISALMKQKTSGGGGTNDNAVADARKRLAKAYQTAADQMAAANDKVRKAQEKLNNAYKEGAESLQQLGFDSEDAAIAQKKAAIELERARETLARAAGAGVNSRAYREAELALQQADLDYRKATDTVNDLAVEQAYAAETGIEGTKEVMDATNDLNEAEADRAKTLRDTTQDIQDAQEALTRVLNSGSSSSSSDALAGLSAEAKAFAEYIVTLQPKIQELKAAAGRYLFPLLTTSIQTLVDKLFPRLIPALELTGRALGEVALDFANTITSAENMDRIDSILKNNVGVIKNLGGAGVNLAEAFIIILEAAGPLITKFSEWVKLTTEGWTETLKAKSATGELGTMFDTAGEKAATIGGVLKTTFGAFFELGKGAEGAGMKIIEAFGGAMTKLKEFAEAGNSDGMFSEGEKGASSLETKFDKIADNFIIIGKFAGEMAKALFDVSGNAGVGAFFTNIMGLPMALSGLANKINSEVGGGFGDFVNEFGKLIVNLGDTGGLKIFFQILGGALKIVNALFSNELFAKVFGFISILAGVTQAFRILYKITRLYTLAVASNFKAIGRLIGALKLKNIQDKIETAQIKLLIIQDKIRNAITIIATGVTKAFVAVQKVLNIVLRLNPIGLIITAVVALIALFIVLYKRSDTFREIIQKIGEKAKAAFDAVIGAVKKVIDWVKQNWPLLLAIITGPIGLAVLFIVKNWDKIKEVVTKAIDKIKEIGAKIWDWIVDKIKIVIDLYIQAWTAIFDFIKGLPAKLAAFGATIWNWIVDFFTQRYENLKTNIGLMVEFVKGLPAKLAAGAAAIWTWITDKLSAAYTDIKSKFTEIVNYVGDLKDKVAEKAKGLWDGIKDSFKSALNFIIGKWNNFSLELKFPNSVFGIPLGPLAGKGFTLNTPYITPLAKGGIVPATPGGMLARIGEAGRPERVEPLDPSGMSKRDKALINQMIKSRGGGGEGIVFNIYPSQGMNEIELANIISRKVAWNLRIGA